MDGQIMAEGIVIDISQDWAPYLDAFTDIAGGLLGVFFVVLVIILAVWLGVAVFTHVGKTRAAKRVFGILSTAALAGCLVSMIGWSIQPTSQGGAGFGAITVSGGKQEDLQIDDHKPKQWTVEDVQGDSGSESDETNEPQPTEQPTEPTEEPTTPPPSGGATTPPEDPACPTDEAAPQSDIVRAAWGGTCDTQ